MEHLPTKIYHKKKSTIHVGKYIVRPMDLMGWELQIFGVTPSNKSSNHGQDDVFFCLVSNFVVSDIRLEIYTEASRKNNMITQNPIMKSVHFR